MRPFIIDWKIKEEIETLKAYAEANVFSMDKLRDILHRKAPVIGDTPAFTRLLPFGYKIVYSIEMHDLKSFKHLSMSIDGNKTPNEFVVMEVMQLLGFKYTLMDCYTYLENGAINVMEIESTLPETIRQ